jgi:hypothetical protein
MAWRGSLCRPPLQLRTGGKGWGVCRHRVPIVALDLWLRQFWTDSPTQPNRALELEPTQAC